MGNLGQKLTRDEPGQCNTEGCEGEVWHVNAGSCDPCAEAAYAEFCRAMGWPVGSW